MATRFEVVLHGDDPVALRAAGEEALEEIARLEGQLSLYLPTSEIAHVNALASQQPVKVSPAVFALLKQAAILCQESGGTFDITIAPLVQCWGFMGGGGRIPSAQELTEARSRVGMDLVQLDPADLTVRFKIPGVMLDLGAIGKGYAIERAVEVLTEAGVTSALIHGGTSTVYALGHPPQSGYWTVGIEHPHRGRGRRLDCETPGTPTAAPAAAEARVESTEPLTTVSLRDAALSVSAVRGKFFEAGGEAFGHVLDPRSGQPVSGSLLAALVLPSATETDALSTALLTGGAEVLEKILALRSGMKALLVTESGGRLRTVSRGIEQPPGTGLE